MNIHKNAKTTPKMRALIVARRQGGETPGQIAVAIGVSVVTVRKWLARHASEGAAGLDDRSSRPHQLQTRATDDQRAKVEALRRARQPFWRIATKVGLSRATVARIGKSCGLSHLSALDPKPEIIRYEKETPGEMIHIDIKKLGRIEGIGHRITGDRTGQSTPRSRKEGGKGWEYLHLAVDDHARLAYSEIFPDERRKSCLTFLFNALRFFRSHGVKVWRVMTEFEGSGNDPGDHFPAERRQLPVPSLCQGIENAGDQAQAHQALHPQDQRQSRAVRSDIPARMGLCEALRPFRPTPRCPRTLPEALQPPPPPLRTQRQNPNLEDSKQQPVET